MKLVGKCNDPSQITGKETPMPKFKFYLTLVLVLIIAGATILMAATVAGEFMPVWAAAIGPLLLCATLWLHWRSRRE